MADTPQPQSESVLAQVVAWCDDVLTRVCPEREGSLRTVKEAYSQGMEDGARMTLGQVKKFVLSLTEEQRP